MTYRIEHDNSRERKPTGPYEYFIYDDNRLIAEYWHDFRGDEQGIKFVNGPREGVPFGRVSEFIEGGGPEALRLTAQAVEYLRKRSH